MRRVRGDLLAIVETAYRVEAPDDVWMKGLAEVVRPYLDTGLGLSAFEFFRPGDGLPEVIQAQRIGIPPALEELYPVIFATMDPEIRRRPFRLGPCVTGSEMMGMGEEFRAEPHMRRYAQRFGMFDSIWITAAEPSGWGFGFHAGRRDVARSTPAEKLRWGRLAAHFATAVRLRHRLRAPGVPATPPPPPDAILDLAGNVQEASSGLKREVAALEELRRAVVSLERARGPARREAPDAALARWRALVRGRWSLVDQIEHDGRRYILARENEPVAPGPPRLTARERQVVGYAKLGHDNKLIAYELGVSHSTVRVLIARAAQKLRVRTRAELIRAASKETEAPPPTRKR